MCGRNPVQPDSLLLMLQSVSEGLRLGGVSVVGVYLGAPCMRDRYLRDRAQCWSAPPIIKSYRKTQRHGSEENLSPIAAGLGRPFRPLTRSMLTLESDVHLTRLSE